MSLSRSSRYVLFQFVFRGCFSYSYSSSVFMWQLLSGWFGSFRWRFRSVFSIERYLFRQSFISRRFLVFSNCSIQASFFVEFCLSVSEQYFFESKLNFLVLIFVILLGFGQGMWGIGYCVVLRGQIFVYLNVGVICITQRFLMRNLISLVFAIILIIFRQLYLFIV